jgi:hypothetical protein
VLQDFGGDVYRCNQAGADGLRQADGD